MSVGALRLDLVRGRAPRGMWRRLALLVALALAAWAALEYLDARNSRDILWARTQQARRTQEAPRPATVSAQQERALGEQVKAVNLHLRALNLPWDAIFRTLQAPSGLGVVLLSLDSSGRAGALRVAGRAAKPEDMTDYVAYLAEKRDLKNVYLLKHELLREGGYRFDLEAEWHGAR